MDCRVFKRSQKKTLEPIIMNTNYRIDSVMQRSGGGVVEALWCTGTCGLIQCLRQLSVVAVHYFCDPLFSDVCVDNSAEVLINIAVVISSERFLFQ